jgi:hypothetical protein
MPFRRGTDVDVREVALIVDALSEDTEWILESIKKKNDRARTA